MLTTTPKYNVFSPGSGAHLMVTAALLALASPISALAQGSAAPVPPTQPASPAPPPPIDETWVTDLDPDTPLAPLPDMDVAWPDFDTPLPVPPELPPVLPTQIADGAVPGDLPLPDRVEVTGEPGSDTGAILAADDPLTLPEPVAPARASGETELTVGVEPLPAQVNAEGQHRYRIELGALGDADTPGLRARFDGLSVLRAEAGTPANAAQINRRITEDSDLVNRLLRNSGYYDATLHSSVSAVGNVLLVRFAADPGPLYRYDAVRLNGLDVAGPEETMRLAAAFPIGTGQAIDADALIGAQVGLELLMRETGYPFGDVGEELVTIDHDTRLGDLDQPVVPGARLRLGGIVVDDGGLLGARHIQRIARFRPGEWYRQSAVEDLRRALIGTGLVASADIAPVQGDGDTVDLSIGLDRAPPRTIAAAIGYSSGEGFRLEGSWEHRNMFPPEGALLLRGVLGTQEQLASISYRRSNFMRRDHTLTFQALVNTVDRAAFQANTALLSGRLERQSTLIYQKRWTWSVGFELVATDERDNRRIVGAGRETYFVGALPMTVGYDRSNDLLDPTSGFRLSARVSPELSIRGAAFGYVRAQVDASGYMPVADRVVLAGRLRLGTIYGSDVPAIAPSRRYYAGGGGSVRGYGYQRIGPVDALGDPSGGRSLFEAAVEARIRLAAFGGAFSVVPFIDAGNVYATEYPDFSGLRYGAGVGVRYHSSFGPLRVDVGTPLNPRTGDSRVTVFVSLGQAF